MGRGKEIEPRRKENLHKHEMRQKEREIDSLGLLEIEM
jgi:hypothetical protein